MFKTLKVSQDNITENLCIDVFGKLPETWEKEYYKNRRSKSIINSKSRVKVCIISAGQLFGEQEIITANKSLKSVSRDWESIEIYLIV